jgi:hypothetical protein
MNNRSLCFLFIISFFTKNADAQKISPDNIVESGKTLVELIKVFKTPRKNLTGRDAGTGNAPAEKKQNSTDSCAVKKISDLCYKNSTGKSLAVSIYKRNGEGYDAIPFTMKVLSQKEECWFELKAGIYKYRIEVDEIPQRILLREGEFRLEACDNMQREITE